MRKVLLLLVLLTLVFSCGKSETIEERLQIRIGEEIKKTMNDPSSYEFVSLKIEKTLTVGEMKNGASEEKYEKMKSLMEKVGEKDTDGTLSSMRKQLDFMKGKKDEEIGMYRVYANIRGKNAFGALILSKYFFAFLNDKELTLLRAKQQK